MGNLLHILIVLKINKSQVWDMLQHSESKKLQREQMDISSLANCTSQPHSSVTVPKTRKEYNDDDRKAIEKNFRAKTILVCGIGPDEYNKISACQSTKEIWEALQTAHEGTTQVKQSKIDMLTIEHELFRMKDDESIQDMHTSFTSIINELRSLEKIIPRNKLVRKILSVLPSSWESKVNDIPEAKDLQKLIIDELIGNLKTYEIKKKKDHERREPKREKNLVLKTGNNESSGEDVYMAYLKKRFQNMVRRNGALAAWGDSSSESGEDDAQGDTSMMEVDSEADDYDSIFALMEKSNDDDDEKKLISLTNVLIDAYKNVLINAYKNALPMELREVENERDDLVIIVADLKEIVKDLMKEKNILIKKEAMKESNQKWYMDSGCSKHMTGSINNFLSLKTLHGWVTNLVTGEVVLVAKRYKNIYVADFESLQNGDLTCLSDVDDDVKLWHRRLGYASYTLLNKLVRKNPVRGLPKSSFKDHKVCDACIKGKQFRSSFKPENEVITSRPLDLLHMDLCGPMRVPSRRGKKYIFVIVDDYSRFTWALFLKTKDETFSVFVAFVKKIQVKLSHNVVCIRFDHDKEFDNAKFDEFCAENGTSFWAEVVNTACYLVNMCLIRKYSHDKIDQDGEQSTVPSEVIDMANGKADMMSHVKESNDDDDAAVSLADVEEPGSSITTIEVENRVVDAVQGTLNTELRSGTHVNNGSYS
ncbi:uncharacterized protein LOC107775971 [Nicotiana tabacum]|uniref:Uncharacterized protein LOC107775971 n=1 Tax=Nicotiana tabacum TaxID=4097 RepID=A0AC58SEM9_TOBAC